MAGTGEVRRAATFLEFVSGLGVVLTPAQRVLAMVAFDGVQPGDLGGEEREIARMLFGDVLTVAPEVLAILAAVCGARGGKTYVLVALRMLHLALTVSLASLAPGEQASAILVAPDLRLARQGLRYALGAAESSRAIRSLIVGRTEDSFTLARRGEGRVAVECLPATSGGSAVRGRSLVGAAMDEGAFFRSSDYQVNDVEIFKALAPRVMPGGQLVIASTPWAEAGLLFDLFSENHGRPLTALAAHAPTLLLRNDATTRSIVAREERLDPENAAREFGAQFMSVGSTLLFDPAMVDAAMGIGPGRAEVSDA